MNLSLAVETEGTPLQIRESLVIDCTLELDRGIITLKQVEFGVVDAVMSGPVQMLLGDSLLKQMGIDVTKELENLVGKTFNMGPAAPAPPRLVDDEELDIALEAMINRAIDKGLPQQHVARLRQLVANYAHVFRVRLDNSPAAKVRPYQVRLKPNQTPYRTGNRRYPPLYRQFMKHRVQELLEFDMAYVNPRSRYASAGHVVPKKLPPVEMTDLRWTVDLKQINARTDPILWPMPLLEVVMEQLAGSECFITIDFQGGYWQIPLHPESQEYFSMVTDAGVVTPTRLRSQLFCLPKK